MIIHNLAQHAFTIEVLSASKPPEEKCPTCGHVKEVDLHAYMAKQGIDLADLLYDNLSAVTVRSLVSRLREKWL